MHQPNILRFFREPSNNKRSNITSNIVQIQTPQIKKTNVDKQIINIQTPTHTLYFDGCSKGNPGIAGAGAVLYELDTEIRCATEYLGIRTNNYAEYSALILGLQMVLQNNPEVERLNVKGDSMLVIKQMLGEYRVKHPDIIPLYKEVCKLSKNFKYIRFDHVLRDQNKRADVLSNIAVMKTIYCKKT